ncbi:hypothetical protein CDV31_015783 [Fusarium ambrosium]|uniref:Uncharacterized protein n=1 Tax=Fusarium ambrosium TaxID=131363 RepID=A0A428SJL9_9HYPO|nr:hypothetical protein CDV31_015783 [Fusarium ambrosium]
MDMVQVQRLDDSTKELVQRLHSSNTSLQPMREVGTGWQEYVLSQELRGILQSFRLCHGASIARTLQAQGKELIINEKRPFQFLNNGGVSIPPDTLIVLIPLPDYGTGVKFKARNSRIWHVLPWEPGTYIRVPWGCEVQVEAPGSAFGLMVEMTWAAGAGYPI